jgi:pyridoxine 4-dehydrogenase
MKFSLNVNVVVLAILVAGAEAFVERAPKLRLARATCPISAVSQGEGESRREFFQKAAAVPAVVACVASAVAGLPKAAAADVVTASSGIEFPPMGLGAWAWGDSLFWGYNPKNDEELRKVFDYAVDNSKSKTTLFDTAEIYGFGRSEKLIGDFSKKYDQDKIQVATKFAALPFRSKAQDVVKAAQASSDRLGRPIDLYQIHFPNAWSNAEYWDGLAMAYDKGLVKAVGVSNYGVDATRACHAALAKRGIQPDPDESSLQIPSRERTLAGLRRLGRQSVVVFPAGFGNVDWKVHSRCSASGATPGSV